LQAALLALHIQYPMWRGYHLLFAEDETCSDVGLREEIEDVFA